MEIKTKIIVYKWIKPHHHVSFVVFFGVASMFLAYVMSVSAGDVAALFPYISDAGTTVPASCVFGLFLNITSIFAFTSFLIRHRYVEKYNPIESRSLRILNDVSFFLGSGSALGIMLVANFQVSSQVAVHLIGAVLAFGLGLVYCAMQCYISYCTLPVNLSSKLQYYIRCAIVIVALVCFVATFAGSAVSFQQARRNANSTVKRLHWKSTDPGYTAHLVSTFGEWIMVIAFMLFFLTFYGEFKDIRTGITFECTRFFGGNVVEGSNEENVGHGEATI